jgi:hypothetical protein
MLTEEKRQTKLTPNETHRATLLELGGLERVKEQIQNVRTKTTLEALGRDVTYAAKTLRKHAEFTAVATATLALGIGASTAVFSVVDTVVFRSLLYRDPDLLVMLCFDPAEDRLRRRFRGGLLRRARNQLFEQVSADDGTSQALVRPDGSGARRVALVTTNWLATPASSRWGDFAPGRSAPVTTSCC